MILYEEVLREFQKQKVKYVLAGGVAFNLLGGERTTLDLDILVEMSDANLFKVVKILKKAGYHVRQPVDPLLIADKKTRQDWIKNKHMKAFNFYKDDEFKQVDIIIDSPVQYQEAVKTCKKITHEDLVLPVVSIDNLIKMKTKGGRNIDKSDITELKKIKKLMRK